VGRSTFGLRLRCGLATHTHVTSERYIRLNREASSKFGKWEIMRNIVLTSALVALSCLITLASTSNATEPDVPQRADAIIQTFVDAHVFQGVVLMAEKGEILFEKAYGKAQYEFDVDNSLHTRFQIASLSKGFTSAAIMLLAERKQIDLDAPLEQIIPAYPNGDVLTLDHLLTHRSGIPNINSFENYGELQLRNYETAAPLVDVFKNKALDFVPGEKTEYSNSNYALLAHVIEVVSNISYAEFLRINIFAPLQMDNTGHRGDPSEIIPMLADGYSPIGALGFGRAPFLDWSVKTGNGSLYSTVHDLFRFHEAMQGTEFLSSHSIKRSYGFARDLGSGWFPGSQFGKRMVVLTGRSPGFVAYFQRFIDDDRCLIVLSNLYLGPPNQMRDALSGLLVGEVSESLDFEIASSWEGLSLEEFVGEYQFGDDWYVGAVKIRVENRNSHLAVVYLDGDYTGYELLLVPMGPGRFFDRTHGAIVRFEMIPETNVYQMAYEYGSIRIAKPIGDR
jgi:CubicO group peptidase (beta-lactamase class C family)